MADRQGLTEAWSKALKVNARYYETLGQLTATWLRELADVSSTVRLPHVVKLQAQPRPPQPASGAPVARAVTTPPAADAAPTQIAALVLEAAGTQQASGAFLVENTLGRAVHQAVEAGPFVGAMGEHTALSLTFEPLVIDLAAGEQVVVRATVEIPADLAGERRGTVRVAGVPGAEIPLVIRRLGG